MIFVDTNYFLRFFRDDIPEQTKIAKKLFLAAAQGKQKLLTSTIVFFEIFWVISTFYDKGKKEVVGVLEKFLEFNFIELEERDLLQRSVDIFKDTNLELEDCYNLSFAISKKVTKIATFDKKLLKYFK